MPTMETKVLEPSIMRLTTKKVSLLEKRQMAYHAQPCNSQPALCGPPVYCFLLSLISISIPTPTIPWAFAITLPLSPHSYIVASLPQHCHWSLPLLFLSAQAELQVRGDVCQREVVGKATVVLLLFIHVLVSVTYLSCWEVPLQPVMV